VKIKNPNQETLRAAVELMATAMKGQLVDGTTFHIYQKDLNRTGICVRLPNCAYPVDIVIEGGQIKIHGDSMDLYRAQQLVEEFYKVAYMQQQIQTLGGSLNGLNMGVSYDQRQEKAKLEVSWY